jgi:NTP pyrophosphatase (non-canonical NTP hydrolase)
MYKEKDLVALEHLITKWARERGLLTADVQPEKQMLKLVEEVGELAKGVAYRDKWSSSDGIGDVFVCLVVLAEQLDMTLTECVNQAYNEIKNRKGVLEDGLFKKDNDIP